MPRTDLNDITAFLAVAREGSFTKAAAKLSVTQSALSQTVRNLEGRLGLRPLTRTTRNIAPTEAGERIIEGVGPKLDEVMPSWRLRLHYATNRRQSPSLAGDTSRSDPGGRAQAAAAVSDIKVEIIIDNGLTILWPSALMPAFGSATGRQGHGGRAIGPDLRMAVVGAPDTSTGGNLLARPRRSPSRSASPAAPHRRRALCLEFEKGDREIRVRVEGRLAFRSATWPLKRRLLRRPGLRSGGPRA